MKLFLQWSLIFMLFVANIYYTPPSYSRGITGVIGTNVAKEKFASLAQQEQFKAVGCIKQDNKIIASCVLISPQCCLTAAHVFDDNLRLQNLTIEINGRSYKGSKKIIHKKYKKDNIDLALIFLNIPIVDIVPATLYSGSGELHCVSTFVGYGAFGTALKPDMEVDNVEKIAGTNMIDQIGGNIPNFSTYPSHFLLEDLDNPSDTSCCNSLGESQPTSLEYIPTGGDSGGGLFFEENGRWYLIGIFSEFEFTLGSLNKTGLYGTVAAFVRITLFADWIDSNTKSEKKHESNEK